MKPMPINLQDKFSLFDEQWTPKVIAEMNDYQFKVVKLEGEFVWHQHADTDEVFMVVEGELTIAMRDDANSRDVHLSAGELFVVPKGVEHKPMAAAECKVMLIEPRGVKNTGDLAENAVTAPNDVWI